MSRSLERRRVALSVRSRLPLLAGAAGWALTAAAPAAVTVVIDGNTGTLGNSFRNLALSPSGLLAFDAGTDTSSQRGVFTFDPTTGTLTNHALATTTSTSNAVIRDFTQVRINSAGTVGFQVIFGGSTAGTRPQGVYTAAVGSGSTLIVKSGATTTVNGPVALNNALSFLGLADTGLSYVTARSSTTTPDNRWLLNGTGSGTMAISLDNAGAHPGVQGGGFRTFGSGVTRADGAFVAFGAVHLPGLTQGDSGAYLLNTATGVVTTIADEDSDPNFSFVAAPTEFLSDGDLVYQTTSSGNQVREFRRYDIATGSISTILDNDGDLAVPSAVQVNAAGQIAYNAILDPAVVGSPLGVSGVYAGLDPIADEVAAPGASLLGGVVISAGSALQVASGDIYFAYTLDTDNNGIADTGGIARTTRPTINAWNNSGGGDFLTAGNWSDGVAPNGVGVRAKLGGALTGPGAITLNAAATLDALSIEDDNSYSIAGTGALTFDGPRYHLIGVLAGQHTISVPVTINKSGGAINVDGVTSSLTLDAPLTFANPAAYFRKNGTGQLNVRNIRAGALDLGRGTLRIQPDGTAAGLSVVNTIISTLLSVPGGGFVDAGSLDLTNNALIVDYAIGELPLADIAATITRGYAAGAWTGTGITSSTAAATPGTAIGFAEASALGITSFFGQAVDADAILVRYTRIGDADLDGTTAIGDFSLLAANFNAAATTWATGDFDFDGQTGIGDFSLLAANFNLSVPASLPRGATVPEPASGLVLAAGALLVGRRRGRRAIEGGVR